MFRFLHYQLHKKSESSMIRNDKELLISAILFQLVTKVDADQFYYYYIVYKIYKKKNVNIDAVLYKSLQNPYLKGENKRKLFSP